MKLPPGAILGRTAADFFAGKYAWIIERIRKVVTDKVANVAMDVEIAFGEHPVSVNLTVLPLTSGDGAQLGTLLMIEDISTEKRVKATMARYMDPAIAARMLDNNSESGLLGGAQFAGDHPILRYPRLHNAYRGIGRARHRRLLKRILRTDGRVHCRRGRYARQVYRRRHHGCFRASHGA